MTSHVGGMPDKKPGPMYTAPSHTNPVQITGYIYEGHTQTHVHSAPHHYHCPPVYEAPVCHKPAPAFWDSSGYILVLFILLVIISRGLYF